MPSSELETAEVQPLRIPSPLREELPSRELENAEGMTSVDPPNYRESMDVPDPDERASTDVEDSPDEYEDGDPQWSSIRHGRARSLDSARASLRDKKIIYLKPSALSAEQEKAVEAATESLTQEQKEHIQQCQVVAQPNKDSIPGPSCNKGKTVDPREWGNAGINPEELDINIQQVMMAAYEKGQGRP